MNMSKTVPALLLAITLGIAGCGKDEPEPPKESFGGGLGKSYNDMLDQTKQTVEQANQQMQDAEQRARPTD
jgi:hypothetical protein